jgi:hypothetical protein
VCRPEELPLGYYNASIPIASEDGAASGRVLRGRRHLVGTRLSLLVVAVAAFAMATIEATAQSPALTSATPPAGKSERLDEVTVTARRAQLAPKIRAFVNQIATLQPDGAEGLARWLTPVCPEVTGLPRQQGEFVLQRISEIARAAGVPLAGEHCRPNLFNFVTADPQRLLQAMEQRKRAVTFSNTALPLTVHEFIATPRPVRVWYNVYPLTHDDSAPTGGFSSALPCSFAQVIDGALPRATTYCDMDSGDSSRVASTLLWKFSDVYVIVDRTRLQGVSLGQLAEYIAMAGLAELKPGAHFGDAPTILKLFDAAPQEAPAAMSDWDQAFLKALYTTDQRSKIQRALIANGMVRDIVH